MTDLSRKLTEHVADVTPDAAPSFNAVLSRSQRRRRRRQAGWAASSVAVVVVGAVGFGGLLSVSGQDQGTTSVSGQDQGTTTGPGPSDTRHSSHPSTQSTVPIPPDTKPNTPPPVQFLAGGKTVNIAPYSFCWFGPEGDGVRQSGLCADGWLEDKDLVDVADRKAVDFWFAADGDWNFQATFSELGEKCPRRITVPVEKTGEGSFRVTPAGLAGDYRVDLFGRGRQGSVGAAFKWSTLTRGTMPQPDAYMGLVSGAGGDLQTYGLELSVSDLAATPQTATARVTVTASNGRSMSIDAHRKGSAQNCRDEGSVFFTGDRPQSQQFLALGPAPYTYDVALTLDGSTYAGQGVWPTDERKSERPYVTLTFDPPLPAFTGDN